MYLGDLGKLYTPADHISAKRGEFEGRRQQANESPMAYLSIMLRLYNRAQYNEQNYLIERFLAGLLNETLKLQLILHHKHAMDYESMRSAVVECHATLVKAIRIGKGTPTFNVTGLTQQSDVASSETYAQWRRRSKPGNKDASEPMDLTQIENILSRAADVLFFMGQDNLDLRDHETEEDLAYWEEELISEDTTITEMVRGRADTTNRPLKARSELITIMVTRSSMWSRKEFRQPCWSRPDHQAQGRRRQRQCRSSPRP